ncbi:MAG: Rrf2 family transcriptional regulator [Acidiferrobacterales bacterium]
MRLSRKARFGITAMIRLGLREGRGTKTLSDLSMDQGISLSYLEQLFAQLRKNGLVVGVRGPGGGYRLARKAGEISLASIITAVDELAYPGKDVSRASENPTDRMWVDVSDRLFDFLGHVTLADVLQGYPEEAKEPGNDTDFGQFLPDKVA